MCNDLRDGKFTSFLPDINIAGRGCTSCKKEWNILRSDFEVFSLDSLFVCGCQTFAITEEMCVAAIGPYVVFNVFVTIYRNYHLPLKSNAC